ncbi:MAG: RNA polymerase sigma factor, partial [Gemmataceae bacterium]
MATKGPVVGKGKQPTRPRRAAAAKPGKIGRVPQRKPPIRELSPTAGRLTHSATVRAEDNRLIAECLEGRTEAFGELVRRYQDRLYNTVYRIVNNAEDAQDVLQEAFLSAYQSLESFKRESLFFTWLYRIAVNTAMSLKRKHKVALSLELGREESNGRIEPSDVSEGNQPGYHLEKHEQERRIQDALNRLSPEHRAVLVLKEMEGQKYETIAEI